MNAHTAYLFRHALLRDAAYQLQLPSKRAALHKLAADTLERLHGGPPGELPADAVGSDAHAVDAFALEICEHLRAAAQGHRGQRRARLQQRLALYLARAARFARSHFRHAQARELFAERAALNAQRPAEAALDLVRAAEDAAFAFDRAAAFGLIEAALKAAGQARDPGVTFAVLLEQARQLTLAGQAAQAAPALERLLVEVEATGDSSRKGRVLYNLGFARQRLGEESAAGDAYRGALACLARAERRQLMGAVLNNLAGVTPENAPQTPAMLLREALNIAVEHNDLRGQAYALANLAENRSRNAQTEEAARLFRESLELHRQTGNREQEAWVTMRLAQHCRAGGDLPATEALYRRAIQALEGTGLREWLGGVWSRLAGLLFESGREAEAEQAAAEAALALRANESPAARQYLESIDAARARGRDQK